MAERRMFAKTIIDSDSFLDMPSSTQNLYFHLSMRADDDGFINNPKKIQRMIGVSEDDLKLLIAKNFIIPFDSGVCVIKHWKIHNYIRNDRYKETVYEEEKLLLSIKNNGAYTLGIPNGDNCGYQLDTQDRLGKDRLGKDRLDYQRIVDMYNDICISFPKCTKLSDARKKSIKARYNTGYTEDDFKKLFEMAEESTFLKGGNNSNWSANFDWLIKDANIIKVLDGNYSDNKNKENKSNAKTITISGRECKLDKDGRIIIDGLAHTKEEAEHLIELDRRNAEEEWEGFE